MKGGNKTESSCILACGFPKNFSYVRLFCVQHLEPFLSRCRQSLEYDELSTPHPNKLVAAFVLRWPSVMVSLNCQS